MSADIRSKLAKPTRFPGLVSDPREDVDRNAARVLSAIALASVAAGAINIAAAATVGRGSTQNLAFFVVLGAAQLNRPTAQPEHYEVQLITRDGRHLSLGQTVLGGTHRTWGAQIPVNLTQVSQLRFEAASGQSTITADLNPENPWSPG